MLTRLCDMIAKELGGSGRPFQEDDYPTIIFHSVGWKKFAKARPVTEWHCCGSGH